MNKQLVRLISAVSLLGVVLAWAVPARGADQAIKTEKKMDQFEGVIKALDATAGTVTIEHKEKTPLKFVIGSDCRFFAKHVEGKAAITDFMVGKRAKVWYTADTGVLTVHRMIEPGSNADTKERKADK